ncbi:PAS domain-containing protein [Erythrobacter sp. NE805]|uniref:PAS domain-containing sensor histidine kinase n=1 Tax=Erythrobacter sp. NE805 TaxID=3389875 RepID=UPI00396AF764
MADHPYDLNEALFRAAFDALPEAAVILEPIGGEDGAIGDWRYLAANRQIGEFLGLHDVTGRTLRECWPNIADAWMDEFAEVLATGKPMSVVRKGSENPNVYETTLTPLPFAGRKAIMATIRDASAEHRAREKRREADARYKLLFDAIDEGFCIIEVIFDASGKGHDYRFLEANDAFVGQTGLVDPIGKRMRSLQPDIEDYWPETYGRIARSGVAERFESASPAMGRWFDVFAFPIGDAAPYQVGILFEDIAERKRMEFALRDSESRLQSLIDASSDLVYRMNPEGTVVERVGGKDLFGDVGARESDWVERFVLDSDRAMVRAVIDDAIARRVPFHVECRVVPPDGSVVWLSSRAVPVLDEAGAITQWFGMAADITERRNAESQVVHSAQMLLVATEIGKVAMWDWNVETGDLVWSDEHFRIEGYEVGEVTPTYEVWAERVHPDDRAGCDEKVEQARASGEDYVNEYRIVQRDGQMRWVSARGRFLYDDTGKAVRMLGAMIDITQRRREEEWQRLLVAELQHRVRNLIGMVRSVARLSAPSHRNVDDYVDHLIGRLQAMGRTQSTLTRSPGRSVDLAELVREELVVHAVQPDMAHVDGPEVALSPHAAEIVTLAIHELATNSVKYGALGDTGYIRIVWSTYEKDNKPWVALRWQETAPRGPTKNNRKGFGRRLIEERVPYELEGEGRFTVHDTGMLAELEFPLSDAGSILDTRT